MFVSKINSRFVPILTVALLLSSFAGQSVAQSGPTCRKELEDTCDVTQFTDRLRGGQGLSFSSNGFFFELVDPGYSGAELTIRDKTNLSHVLDFPCNTTRIDLPNQRQYVTLILTGLATADRVDFVARNANGTLTDEEVRFNATGSDGSEAVYLVADDEYISTVHMHIVDSNCALWCDSDQVISEVRACDVSAQ